LNAVVSKPHDEQEYRGLLSKPPEETVVSFGENPSVGNGWSL
jgi:hypothetical protein